VTSLNTPLEYFAKEKKFDSVSEIVRTAVVYAGNRYHRLGVLKNYSNPNDLFNVRRSVQEAISVDGKERKVWVEAHLPWVSGKDPDEALGGALRFLSEEISEELKHAAEQSVL
jgi:hypothetical protein